MTDADKIALARSALAVAKAFIVGGKNRPLPPVGSTARRTLEEVQQALDALRPGPRPGWPIQRNGTGAPMADLPDPSADELARLSRAVQSLGG